MQQVRLSWLAAAGLLSVSCLRAQYADSVVAYNPGVGFSAGYTNATAALGSPSRQTLDPDPTFGGTFPVDPFSPPYLSSQVVSIGTGGSLTVRLDTPALNDPAHPFGVDFILFGDSGFIITNGNFSGGGVTDGSLFANNNGATRVSVSLDNVTYYALNPALAPNVDGLFPTDGNGDFQRPVNPALAGADFSGKDLAGIRGLYGGSGGGTGFDIAWAQDNNGNRVTLPGIQFVRVDVLSDKSEIDGFAVVPEPATWALGGFLSGILWIQLRRTAKEQPWPRNVGKRRPAFGPASCPRRGGLA
jgi:hypothetical protein